MFAKGFELTPSNVLWPKENINLIELLEEKEKKNV